MTIGTLDVAIAMFAFHATIIYLVILGGRQILGWTRAGRAAGPEKRAVSIDLS
jgi:hypothetical protein